jgi:hypothetical protein
MIAGLAIILTDLALIPAGAHLFVIPNKINRAQQDYFVAQSLYRGWARFGIVLISTLAVNITLSIVWHGKGMNSYLAGAAALCMGVTLAIFFTCISCKPLDQ